MGKVGSPRNVGSHSTLGSMTQSKYSKHSLAENLQHEKKESSPSLTSVGPSLWIFKIYEI